MNAINLGSFFDIFWCIRAAANFKDIPRRQRFYFRNFVISIKFKSNSPQTREGGNWKGIEITVEGIFSMVFIVPPPQFIRACRVGDKPTKQPPLNLSTQR